MRVFDRIFKRPSWNEIKALFDEVDANNQLYRAVLDQVMPGQALRKDYNQKQYVQDGFEKNADVFAIIDRLTTMLSQIPIQVVEGQDETVVENELSERLRQPNNYQVWQEWSKLWYTFYLVTGNAIKYAPRLKGGNDRGKLMPGGMYIMPTQHTQIESGGWRDPIRNYVIDLDPRERIPAEDIIHVRMPNLNYKEGAQFMGMSPLKVAALIIEAENQGYQTVADTLARGIPPGVLTKVDANQEQNTSEQQAEFERVYKEKYGNQKYRRVAGVPVLTIGDVKWIQMGFSNFRDLQILELSQHGLRVLCNVLGVPSHAFNDSAGTTFNNMGEARKMVYTNRLMPDLNLLLSYFNATFVPAYGDKLKIQADYSEIPELQEDKKDLAVWLEAAVRQGLPPEEMLKRLGLPVPENPALARSYLPFNVVPAEEIGLSPITDTQAGKILDEHNIDDYKGLKAV